VADRGSGSKVVRSAGAGRLTRRARRAASRRRGRGRTRGWLSLLARATEHLLSGAAIALGGLAVLERASWTGRSWVLAAAVAILATAGAAFAVGLDRLRARLGSFGRWALASALVAGLTLFAWHFPPDRVVRAVGEIVAGERATQSRVIRHQVYAAYRRMDLAGQRVILQRSEVFAPTIRRAAAAFGIEEDLLAGIASAESSFRPRESRDGGRGLFQITAVPAGAVSRAKQALGVGELDAWNEIHNAFLAAATLAEYARQMDGDLFLTLLAYNVGPQNGGLETILRQYGARNFAQVQPYLQPAPREYPVRVLVGALSYRIWRRYGELPRYEDPEGARRVQAVEFPGLSADGWLDRSAEKPAAAR
jgi:soluble lytic murein transglycosylase-like protein